MARTPVHPFTRTIGFIAALSPAMLLGACADTAGLLSGEGTQLANSSGADTAGGSSELKKATDYWGKQYQGNPADKTAALSYAKNLKAMGDKRSALAVLQDSVSIHSNDPEVAGEYGRLALERGEHVLFDQAPLLPIPGKLVKGAAAQGLFARRCWDGFPALLISPDVRVFVNPRGRSLDFSRL